MLAAELHVPVPFSWTVMLVLAVVLAASAVTFHVLIARWTDSRPRHALREWAKQYGYHAGASGDWPPLPPGTTVEVPEPHEQFAKASRNTSLLRLRPSDAPGRPWHLLVRRLEATWPATGIRPVALPAGRLLLDRYGLAAFPVYTGGERFVAHGTESASAKALAESTVVALVPPDVAILLIGSDLVVDFSARPFDAIEFNRMIALSEQLVAHLPAARS